MKRILMFLLAGMIFSSAEAARFSLDPQDTSIGTNRYFTLAVTLDAVWSVNAVRSALIVPDALEPVAIQTGNSVVNLWIDGPRFDPSSGRIVFSGITPGGFSGHRGRLFSITFQVVGDGDAKFAFDSQYTKVFLNTEEPTADDVTFEAFILPIVAGKDNLPVSVPDGLPPEYFIPVIMPSVVDTSVMAVVFVAQDKSSGVRNYTIAESRRLVGTGSGSLLWHEARSPYVLKDQSLLSYVYVRAEDYAGNVRVVVLPPQSKTARAEAVALWIFLAGVFGLIGLCVVRKFL